MQVLFFNFLFFYHGLGSFPLFLAFHLEAAFLLLLLLPVLVSCICLRLWHIGISDKRCVFISAGIVLNILAVLRRR